jgi:ankyrin repeat protein
MLEIWGKLTFRPNLCYFASREKNRFMARLGVFILSFVLSITAMVGAPSVWADPASPPLSWRHGKADQVMAVSGRGAPEVTKNQLLMLHAGSGDITEVKQDLARGADINYRIPISGLTPLMVTENPEMMALLLQYGADIKATDIDGTTVLHHAVLAPRALELIPLLIRQGAEVNHVAAGRGGETPLLVARQWFFEERDRALGAQVMELLAKNGADVNAADHTGYTLLMVAAVNNKPDLLTLMLALGADPHLQNREGLTALDYARSLKFAEIERLLRATAAP